MQKHIAIALSFSLAPAAGAQTVRFLVPETFTPAPSAELTVGVAVDGNPPADWPVGRVEWMFIRGGGQQENRHDVQPAAGTHSVPATSPAFGAGVIGVELSPANQVFDRETLAEFLSERVAFTPAPPPLPVGETVLIRRVESAAAIIRSLRPGEAAVGGTHVATDKTGLRAEIRALMDPTALPPGSDLSVRVYINGDKRAGAVLTAARGQTMHRVTANESGIAFVPLTEPGEWRVQFHHAAIEPEGFTLYSGTLTFQVPGDAGEAKP